LLRNFSAGRSCQQKERQMVTSDATEEFCCFLLRLYVCLTVVGTLSRSTFVLADDLES